MKRTPKNDQLPVERDVEADIEVFEPAEHDPAQPTRPRGFRSRLTASVPGAVAGVFLVCALAFGATLQATGSPGSDSDGTPAGETTGGKTAGDAPLAYDGEQDKDEPIDGERFVDPTPGDEGTPDGETPEAELAPVPEPRAIDLRLALGDGGRVRLEWGACAVDGFAAWKLVRSTDSGATFPLGAHDTLIAAIEDQGKTAFTDTSAPKGKKLWYAVVGLAGDGDARFVACNSSPRAIRTPAPPAPKPTVKPAPTAPPALGLTLAVKEGAVYIDFSECKIDGADYYKVVRSTDSTVKWPAGEGDTLVAAVGIGGKTAAWDKGAPAGKKAWYRVFCVNKTEDGYKVLNSSPVRGITAPAVDPAPEPKAMWIEVKVDGGHVVVHWEGCGGEQFSHYRILRRTGDSTTVVAEFEDAAVTTWVDESVEAGGTYKYLVQSKGVIEGSYVLLGSTDWAAVTVE
ncbi:MAG: hypothetical protein A2Z32_06770 [Chloroflexi bacterium RBG_16_69_14]|nr:MAG: hypothetical protein A2Z32_06770 [Chloroflexi bacterium RBG_16_69_14]